MITLAWQHPLRKLAKEGDHAQETWIGRASTGRQAVGGSTVMQTVWKRQAASHTALNTLKEQAEGTCSHWHDPGSCCAATPTSKRPYSIFLACWRSRTQCAAQMPWILRVARPAHWGATGTACGL